MVMQFLFSTTADCCIVSGGPLALSFLLAQRSWSLAETKSARTFGPVHTNLYIPYDAVTKSCGYMLSLGRSIFGVHLFVRILELNLTLYKSSLEPNTLAYTASSLTRRQSVTGFRSGLLDIFDTSRTLSPN